MISRGTVPFVSFKFHRQLIRRYIYMYYYIYIYIYTGGFFWFVCFGGGGGLLRATRARELADASRLTELGYSTSVQPAFLTPRRLPRLLSFHCYYFARCQFPARDALVDRSSAHSEVEARALRCCTYRICFYLSHRGYREILVGC